MSFAYIVFDDNIIIEPKVEIFILKYLFYFFMKKVKVTRSYQVTIPVEVREKLDIEIGDELFVRVEEDRIVMEKVKKELPAYKVGRRIGEQEIEEALLRGLRRALIG